MSYLSNLNLLFELIVIPNFLFFSKLLVKFLSIILFFFSSFLFPFEKEFLIYSLILLIWKIVSFLCEIVSKFNKYFLGENFNFIFLLYKSIPLLSVVLLFNELKIL